MEMHLYLHLHRRQVSGFPMEVSVAFAAGPPPTPANIKISCYRLQRRGGHYLTPPPANMSASRSYQCLSCRFKDLSVTAPKIARRQFHATVPKTARKSAFPNVKADKLGLTEPAVEHSYARVRPYTEREKKLLAMKYTPDQMEAIEVGEASIGDEDLRIQGRPRTDPMRISYFDDFSKVRPMIDFPVEGAEEEDVATLLKTAPKIALRSDKPPTLDPAREREAEDIDPRILRLSQQTGMSPKEISRLRVKNLVNHRVVNQTRMGKIQSLYFLTIAGNENGMLGIGEGKAAEDEDGRRQAMMNAIRNMRPVPRYEERTIYGDVEAKVGASVVQLSARSPGMLQHDFETSKETIQAY
jgi:small subunit ribosomal protein S5